MNALYHQAIEQARNARMTDDERETQLISRVYGNLQIEHPEITRDLVRQAVTSRTARQAHNVVR